MHQVLARAASRLTFRSPSSYWLLALALPLMLTGPACATNHYQMGSPYSHADSVAAVKAAWEAAHKYLGDKATYTLGSFRSDPVGFTVTFLPKVPQAGGGAEVRVYRDGTVEVVGMLE